MEPRAIAKYIRLSLEDAKTESMSIEGQRRIMDEYIGNMDTQYEQVLEFVDNGHSGTSFERPEVQKLLELVRQGKIGCIIVKDFSRFGRNSIDMGYFIDKVFPLYHTRFISVTDQFDTLEHADNANGLDVAFKYLINELYSRDLSKKIKSTKHILMRAGEYQSVICCYGYRKGADKRLEIDEEAAAVVREIFSLALQGKSSNEIAQTLYARGIPTPGEYKALNGRAHYDISRAGRIWQQSTILRILDDERYIGTYIHGKRAVTEVGGHQTKLKPENEWFKIPGHHPAIVDEAVFTQVQALRRTFRCDKHPRQYPLRGKVVCGCCQHAMSRTHYKNPTFYCRFTRPNPDAECHGLRIYEEELHGLLYEIVSQQARTLLGVADIAGEAKVIQVDFQRQAEQERQIQAQQDYKRKLYEQFLMGEITKENYFLRKTDCDKALARLEQAVQAYRRELELQRMNAKTAAQIREVVSLTEYEGGFSQALSDLLIEKVVIFPDKHIRIDYRVKGFH